MGRRGAARGLFDDLRHDAGVVGIDGRALPGVIDEFHADYGRGVVAQQPLADPAKILRAGQNVAEGQ